MKMAQFSCFGVRIAKVGLGSKGILPLCPIPGSHVAGQARHSPLHGLAPVAT
jgi:hypothetical protein